MGMNDVTTRNRTRTALLLLVVVLAAMAWDGVQLLKRQGQNREIAAGASAVQAADAPPELKFAHAYALAASAAASSAREEALTHYRALQGDTPVGLAARFNSANLLLRQAIEVRTGAQPGQAIPLIELAKEIYREILRQDPQHWDARYNLERAQRLLPDPEEDVDTPPDSKRNAERAATTMRGYSPGLP